MQATSTISLQDFADNRPDGTYAILWFTSAGYQAGKHQAYETFAGVPAPFQGANGTLEAGDWEWDGEGDFTDENANTIRRLKAWIADEEGYRDLISRGLLSDD